MLDFAELIADHKAQLGRAVERFRAEEDADFIRHLRLAGGWIDGRWPRILYGELSLVAMVNEYPAPPGCLMLYGHSWGHYTPLTPWDECGPGFPPLLERSVDEMGTKLLLCPPPTAKQIAVWGNTLRYRYRVAHEITAEVVTVDEGQRGAVLLAALIEAMRDLAAETTVVQLHKGLSGLPTAGTPAYLYETLIREWEGR